MIEKILLLENVGKFESVGAGAQLPLAKMALVYAENGRGKTTLAEVFRSLSTGLPTAINERRRLTAAGTPHIVIKSNTTSYVFQDGRWSSAFPDLFVFDDEFVAQNICSGIDVDTEHRQNLHALIVGAQGVALNSTLQDHIKKVEEHIRELRGRTEAIPAAIRGSLTVDQFCALDANPKIEEAIQQAEKYLAAARSESEVKKEGIFEPFALPQFDCVGINNLLKQTLTDLDAKAAEKVQGHLVSLGKGAETWVGEGMQRLQRNEDKCPFCAQEMSGSPIVDHYRAYFSEEYARLKGDIAEHVAEVQRRLGGDAPAAFERAIRLVEQKRQFWQRFTLVPEISIDTAEIARVWKAAREAVLEKLKQKQAAPLEAVSLDAPTIDSLDNYEKVRAEVEKQSGEIIGINASILIVKEKAAVADVATLAADLEKLKAVVSRYSPATAALCNAYIQEKTVKSVTEKLRDQARDALEIYRNVVFPSYEAAINSYLAKFNAGFRLGSVSSVNTRAGSSCTYNVLINNVPVPIAGTNEGEASFRNTLSAGDRNTLALAFFFVSLDQDPQASQKTVVIDDPMTSLDEHRSYVTILEIIELAKKVEQVTERVNDCETVLFGI